MGVSPSYALWHYFVQVNQSLHFKSHICSDFPLHPVNHIFAEQVWIL